MEHLRSLQTLEFCKIIGISVADVADIGTSGVNDPGYNQKSSFPAILQKSIQT